MARQPIHHSSCIYRIDAAERSKHSTGNLIRVTWPSVPGEAPAYYSKQRKWT